MLIASPQSVVQVLDAGMGGCLGECSSWPTAERDAGPDVELVLEAGSSGAFSQEASAVSGASSGPDSISSISGASSGSLSDGSSSLSPSFSSSTADLTSLASSFCTRVSHTCVTDDGWRLHIMHVYDASLGATPPAAAAAAAGSDEPSTSGRRDSSSDSRRPQHPVLMVPGLASSGEHTFDLLPDSSLVNALVARGYDVWMADLRGNGRSQKPSLLDRSTWWTVDDHFLHDVPAVLQYVLNATGAKQVHWVGHSMGGMLAVGLQSQQPKLAAAVRSITMLASGCFGAGSWHSLLKPVISCLTALGFPAAQAAWVVSVLSGTAALLPLETLFYWPGNMPAAAARRLMANCFQFIPAGVIRQFMGSLNTKQGLAAADGSFLYADPQRLQQVDVPVLALNGSWDLFCPAAGARRTLEMFGSTHKRFVCVGPSHGTGKRHYGHFDILAGRAAAHEVFPHVLSWLEEHDAPLEQQQQQPQQ